MNKSDPIARSAASIVRPGAAGLLPALLALAFFMPIQSVAEEAAAEPIEEITVTGYQLVRLRRLVDEAEDRVLELFNELNDDPKFDIQCTQEAFTGSMIKRKQCRPKYLSDAESDLAESRLHQAQFGRVEAAPPLMAVAEFYTPQLEEKMRETMLENPEFFDAVVEHYHLRQVLEESQRIHLGD